MESVAWSIFGACIALVVRLFVDKREAKLEKQRNCLHRNTKILYGPYNYVTRVCMDCGYQEPVKEDE